MKSTLLLSIHPRFADGILSGVKRVELRRRLPRISSQDTVIVYETVPTKAVVGLFVVESVERLPVNQLWRKVRGIAGVTRTEFFKYFDGVTDGVAIFAGETERFRRPVPLFELRTLWPRFHPPQGFRYLDDDAVEVLHRKVA